MKKYLRTFSIALASVFLLSFAQNASAAETAAGTKAETDAKTETDTDTETESVPIYRRYNPGNGEHFYTTNKSEADTLVTVYGWNDEGIGWYAPGIASDRGNPVYRFYNPTLGIHRYTADKTEREALLHYGWNAEGILCYSMKKGGIPVYRLMNPNNQQENYTLYPAEAVMNIRAGWFNMPYTFYAAKNDD